MSWISFLCRMYSRAFLTSGIFLLSSAVLNAQEPTKILFIGNSYTHMNNMPGIFEKMAHEAEKNVLVEKNTRSGASFKVHAAREEMYVAINSRKWDVVVLQGYSRECSFPREYMDTATVPYVQQILDSIYANNPCTEVMLYMTWGYEDGYKERLETDSYDKMATRIAEGYEYLSEYFQLPIVPVGMVWKQVKSKQLVDLYAPDRAHPSVHGSYLIASTFYSALFEERGEGIYTQPIRKSDAEIIKIEAYNFVSENKERYGLDTNRFWIDYFTSEDGKYKVQFESNYPRAKSIRWELGDGSVIEERTGVYEYDRHGEYTIKLMVEDQCGMIEHECVAEFSKFRRFLRKKKKTDEAISDQSKN